MKEEHMEELLEKARESILFSKIQKNNFYTRKSDACKYLQASLLSLYIYLIRSYHTLFSCNLSVPL